MQLGEADRPVGRLALGDPRMADRVVARRAVAVLEQPRGQPFDHVVVLGMDHDEGALAPRQRQDVEHLVVAELQQVVGHVDLERAVAVADQRRQLLAQHLLARIGDDEVEGVVDDRLGSGGLVIVAHDLAQRLALVLRREGDDGRRPAERRRHRGAVEIVGAHDAVRGFLLDMAVAVDAAGQDQLPRGVDLRRARSEAAAERRDGAVPDTDIAAHGVGRGDDGTVADNEIVLGHAMSLSLRC